MPKYCSASAASNWWSNSRADPGAFSSVVTAESDHRMIRTRKAPATVFGMNMVRLVQLDEYRLDAYLDGVLMVFNHRDVPGIIGAIGTILGGAQGEYRAHVGGSGGPRRRRRGRTEPG